MRINGRNEELYGFRHQEERDYLESKSWKYKNNCCTKCLWKSDCKKTLSKSEKANIQEYGCDDYSPVENPDGGDKYINSIIESGREQYRKEYNDNYDRYQNEWN